MKYSGTYGRNGKYYLSETITLVDWLRTLREVDRLYVKRTTPLEKRFSQSPSVSGKICDDGVIIRIRRKLQSQIIVVYATPENSQIILSYLEKEDYKM